MIVRGLGTPRSTGENFGCSWEHLGAPATSLGAQMTTQGAPARSLGAPGITVKQSRKNILFGYITGEPGNHSYY